MLFKTEVNAKDFNWLIDTPEEPFRASVRIVCDEPVRAPAAGQSAVLYVGEQLIGGGFIV